MTATIALAGDTMLGRDVARVLEADPAAPLVAPDVAERAAAADAFVLNLECCISARGARFPDPRKAFVFRAPPIAAERLAELGVDAVSLANNHALDYGPEALLDTLAHLEAGHREVLLLAAWEELTYEEIAVTLDLALGTVRSRLHRARRQLRVLLALPAAERSPEQPQETT